MPADVVIISGLSGSGLSSALKAFEDLGYFCIDNLPIGMIPTFVDLLQRSGDARSHAALVIDIREGAFLAEFPRIYERLKEEGARITVLFLDASDESLQRRYSETRRPHPLEMGGVLEAIDAEREALDPIRKLATEIIDTTDHTVHSLRRLVIDSFSRSAQPRQMVARIVSFGFKRGLPADLDLLFDVRFLPNPFFVPDLKPLSGESPAVVKFLNSQPEVNETIEKLADLLRYLLPRYEREGKSYVTAGIGCTGGRHRSVAVANALGEKLAADGIEVRVSHRDIEREIAGPDSPARGPEG